MDSRLRTRTMNHQDVQETVIIRFIRLPADGVYPQTNGRCPDSLAGTDGRCREFASRLRRTVILVPRLLLPVFRAAGLENEVHNCHLELVMAGKGGWSDQQR